MPVIPEGLPLHWRTAALSYVPVFEVFEELRREIPFVAGDTGLSSLIAFPPYYCIDVCSYYGGSITMAAGFHLTGFNSVRVVMENYVFLAAGNMGLTVAHMRKIPRTVLIINNGITMATGGQPILRGTFEQVFSG